MKYKILLILLIQISCSQSSKDERESKDINLLNSKIAIQQIDTTIKDIPKIKDTNIQKNELSYLSDTLSMNEKKIFLKIEQENEFFIFSNKVERFYEKNDGKLLYSRIRFLKSDLEKAGYVSFELIMEGEVSEQINISYSFDMGQASHGFGYVIGEDVNSYLHTIKSCGISSCIIQVFDSGKKIFEKEN